MIIFPAIDLIQGQAVRLFKGQYDQMTVYDPSPLHVAEQFKLCGAEAVHLVDLEGARDGTMPNREVVAAIKKQTGLFCEVGGGIRSMEAASWYIDHGLDRVILGTSALTDPDFVCRCLDQFPGKVAIGADARDGFISVKGWTEDSTTPIEDFILKLKNLGCDTFIVTNISRDGAMQGTDTALYARLQQLADVRVTASGGVSALKDIQALRQLNLYAAIIGKAYYTGSIDLKKAIEAAR